MNTKAYTNETVFRGDTVASGSTYQGTKYDDTVVTSIHCPATVDEP